MKEVIKFSTVLLSILSLFACSPPQASRDELALPFDSLTMVALNIDSVRKLDFITARQYADSLNTWSEGELPKFLERDTEIEHPTFSDDSHHLRSFRKSVFDQVENVKVLEAILASEIPFYSVHDKESAIPYSSYSIKDLSKLRLDELSK